MKKGILQVIFVALAVFILDQITKAWAASTFKTVPIDDWFGFTYSENHGIAFGIPVSGNLLLAITAVLIVVLIGFAIKKLPLSKGIYQLTVGLVVGGALGNFFDRIWFGPVRDFIQIGTWPTFNVADMAIVGGVLGLVWLLR